jgi:hypoxanthine phosphoribosyltransferase
MSLKNIRKQKKSILFELAKIEALELEIQTRLLDKLEYAEDESGLPLSSCNISNAVNQLADKIVGDSQFKNPVLISVMDGAMPFAGDLQVALNARGYTYQYTSMQSSSYSGTTSGQLRIQAATKLDVAGRHVFVLDEVCDTGKTYVGIREKLLKQGAASVNLVVLVDKKQDRKVEAHPWATGFVVSKDSFIIGKGLDYDGLLRNLDFIGVADLSSLPTATEKTQLARKKSLKIALQDCLDQEKSRSERSVDVKKERLIFNAGATLKHQNSLNNKQYNYNEAYVFTLAAAILICFVVLGISFFPAALSIIPTITMACFITIVMLKSAVSSLNQREAQPLVNQSACQEGSSTIKHGAISIPGKSASNTVASVHALEKVENTALVKKPSKATSAGPHGLFRMNNKKSSENHLDDVKQSQVFGC